MTQHITHYITIRKNIYLVNYNKIIIDRKNFKAGMT